MGAVADHIRGKLEQDIREKGLLVWLDKEDDFSGMADHLKADRSEGRFPFDVLTFRGSFLQLMKESGPLLAGKSMPRCVVHMPGFNEQDIRQTPALEAYKAGQRWRVSLDTMIREAAQGKLTEDQIEFLLGKDDLCLKMAEEFLTKEDSIPEEIKNLLPELGEDGFVLRFITKPEEIVERLCLDNEAAYKSLFKYFSSLVGLDSTWEQYWDGENKKFEERNLTDILMGYLMAMEFVHDLKEPPVTEEFQRLKKKQKEMAVKCRHLLKLLRKQNAEEYIKWAGLVESNLDEKETRHSADMLGSLDTFRFEADAFLNEAILRLQNSAWSDALKLARLRLPDRTINDISRSFWLKADRKRLWLWRWIEKAAQLGQEITDVSRHLELFSPGNSLEDIMTAYSDSWWKTDMYFRDFSLASENYNATESDLHYKSFVDMRLKLHQLYRNLIDSQSVLWNSICEENGFLPGSSFQQRHFFANQVSPVVKSEAKTAVLFVDALRYELGQQLISELTDIKTTIKPLAAELPTITSVGMNALCPVVQDDRLTLLFDNKNKPSGFKGPSRNVTSPDERKRTIQDSVGKDVSWASLSDFMELKDRKLKNFVNRDLVVLAVPDIDTMGEAGACKAGLNYFNSVIMRIVQGINRLKSQGFTEFIITADHGFLMGDETLQNKRASHLDNLDRRYAFDMPRTGDSLVSVDAARLGYETDDRERSFVFDRQTHMLNSSSKDFYHGGNSLQERIIPVISFSYTAQQPDNSGDFRLVLEKGPRVASFDSLYVSVKIRDDVLFGPESLKVRIHGEADTVLDIQDVSGAEITGNVMTLSLDKKAEILFKMPSGSLRRSRIFFEPVDEGCTLQNHMTEAYFDVKEVSAKAAAPSVKQPGIPQIKSNKTGFSDKIPEEYHTALAHLAKHDTLSDQHLIKTLGGPGKGSRKARRFAMKIDNWLPFLPFDIEIEHTSEGNVYRKK